MSSLIFRLAAQAVQSISAHLANMERAKPAALATSTHDLLKAKRMAAFIDPGDRVLDVGSGHGDRLVHLSLFRSDLTTVGVDLAGGRPTPLPGSTTPDIHTFDGKRVPFDDKSFDIVMTCYVLHHLSPVAVDAMLSEMLRCAKKRILILEDSTDHWDTFYRLRNWMHILDTDLEYASSASFIKRRGIDSFLTRPEWLDRLSKLPRARHVQFVSLDDISRYRHHSLFVVELDP